MKNQKRTTVVTPLGNIYIKNHEEAKKYADKYGYKIK